LKYEYISTLKASERGDILLVRDECGTLFIKRQRELEKELLKKLIQLESPYIAKTLTFGEDEHGFFTIEEYIKGKPASETVFSKEQVVSILMELCEAVKTLHRSGIVHRDIKPSNIIVDDNGHIRLIDFDTARLMKEYQSHDTGYLGTIGYAPPEQYGFMQTDVRSDIYAFGITMDEFLGKSADKLKFRRIIKKCTAFDPEKRYSDMALVEWALKCRFPIIPVFVIACIALTAWGMLWLVKHEQPQKQYLVDAEATDTADSTLESLSTSEPVISAEETSEIAETSEPIEIIHTEEQTAEADTSETTEVTLPEATEHTTMQTQPPEAPTEEAVPEETTEADTSATTEVTLPEATEHTTMQTQPSEAPAEEAVPEETAEAVSEETEEADDNGIMTSDKVNPNKMSYTTVQDENGKIHHKFDYIFYDDPAVYGRWQVCGYCSVDADLSLLTAETLTSYEDNTEQVYWQFMEFQPEGTFQMCTPVGSLIYNDRWTNGYIITESKYGPIVKRIFVITLDDGEDYLFYEQKPTGNFDDDTPHRYLVYKRTTTINGIAPV